jgi:transketolase
MVNEGIKTIASCQACFLSMRCFEQVRQYAGYMELPIIFVGVSSGFALTYFGNTHYALEDITLMRSIPGMNILSPSDPGQAAKAIESAIELSKPVYIRCTGIQGTKPIYSNDFDFRIGKLNILNPGKDLVVFSSGAITRNALDAVIQIKEEIGLDVKLIDVHTISPLDINTLKECMSAKLWISIEEHFTSGGLGSVLMEFLITQDGKRKPSLNRIGVNNKFTVPGDYDFLLRSHGLDKKGIYLKLLEATKKLY